MMETTVLKQIDELNHMSMVQLRKRWVDLFSPDPGPGALGRQYLIRRLAYRIQELAYGGLSQEAKQTLQALAKRAPAQTSSKPRQPQSMSLKPGTRLLREWRGDRYEVIVQQRGFLFNGKHYKSLSAVAKAITGTNWNGYLYFGLSKRRPKQGNV